MAGGKQLRKKLVKFCPACGETVKIPPKDWITCGGCWLVFTVRVGLEPPMENGSTQSTECGIKRKHESKEAAIRHAAELRDIPNRTWEHLCVYQCRFCKSWHVGHLSQRRHKRKMTEWHFVKDLVTKQSEAAK